MNGMIFLGKEQTNIDPRGGLPNPDRVWSSDGKEILGLKNMR